MKVKFITAAILTVSAFLNAGAQDSNANIYRNDFDYLWQTIKDDYAYWDKKSTNWEQVKNIYGPRFDTVSSKNSFILLLENVFNEFYDHHASLNSNTRTSQRLVPSGTDIWAEFKNGKAIIIALRPGFGAEKVGLKPGMEIISVNDVSVEIALKKYLPQSSKKEDAEANNFALRVLLAGRFIDDRKVTVRENGSIRTFYPDRPSSLLLKQTQTEAIESRVLANNIGYVKINDRLWDNGIIPIFDSILSSFKDTKYLIIDLRNTPSGGNTTVARAILGSFIKKEGFYQKHELVAEQTQYGIKRSWLEIVSPRKFIYDKPLVILVGHWTGSVGEGITIGFDALKRGTIVGTTMARLNGANYSYQLPLTKIGFSFPAEKLFHVNGSPRENYKPHIIVNPDKNGQDLTLAKAIEILKK